jgi:hypothetical protein
MAVLKHRTSAEQGTVAHGGWKAWAGPAPSTHHQDEGPQALCQGLTKQPVADVEHLPAAVHQLLLSTHGGTGVGTVWQRAGRRAQRAVA